MMNQKQQYSILFISSDQSFLDEIEGSIRPLLKNYTIFVAKSYREAFTLFDKHTINIILLDIEKLPNQELDIVHYAKTRLSNAEVVIITSVKELDMAMQMLRYGASFYILKPISDIDLRNVVEKIALKLKRNNELLEYEQQVSNDQMAGNPAMQKILKLCMKIAPTNSPVLLGGESGTGKEFFARIIHNMSHRSEGKFVAMNCGAIPDTLFESELFGYKKGAFTGADRDKAGLVEESHMGTLMLDEVGELSLQAQVKLLRFLQEHSYRRVGDPTLRSVDVRIIAASNKNLSTMITEGKFREDLFYRLNVFYLHLPPLRERRETIPSLIRFNVNKYNHILGKNVNKISKRAEIAFAEYHYPGNVRELENIIEHAVILSENNEITEKDLPEFMFKERLLLSAPAAQNREALPEPSPAIETLSAVEKNHIQKALTHFNHNYTETARALGISRSTLWRKINEYALEEKEHER